MPFAFLMVRATCLGQSSLFVMFTPRYRALDRPTSCRIWSLMVYILVSGFRFPHILMDSHFSALTLEALNFFYKFFFYIFSAGIDFRRQNLSCTDVRF